MDKKKHYAVIEITKDDLLLFIENKKQEDVIKKLTDSQMKDIALDIADIITHDDEIQEAIESVVQDMFEGDDDAEQEEN